MEVAVFAVVFVAIVEKVWQRTYNDYRVIIVTTALLAGILKIALASAVFEKLSLLPVLLIFK